MKCESCKKHEATIVYTHIVDDQKKTLHLCSFCSSEEQADQAYKGAGVTVEKAAVDVGHLSSSESYSAKKCDFCGMSYEEFRKMGRLGCHQCYEAFWPQLERLLKRIHGALKHTGKARVEERELPSVEEELIDLRQQLQEAVEAEAYERAAELRDSIVQIESQLKGDAAV